MTLLAAAAAIAVSTPAAAWDYPGHRIVGTIADLVLKQHHPKTHDRVRALLDQKDASGNVEDKRSLGEVAVFPDCAKDEEEFCRRRPSPEEIAYAARNKDHRGFHFTNSPMQLRAYIPGGVGTTDIDVVQMIAYATVQLRGATPPRKDRVELTDGEAVWLLAHLVGDIHQPLHVGAKYFDKECEKGVDPYGTAEVAVTLGGNRIHIAAEPPAVPPAPNLHLYWDGAAVARAMHAAGLANAEQEFAQLLAGTPPTGWETAGPPETWAMQWVSEIMPLALEAHQRLTIRKGIKPAFPSGMSPCTWVTTLDPAYQDWAKEQARIQLAKAGFRLAALLEAIFGP